MGLVGDDGGMSVNDESHRKPSPPQSSQVGDDPTAPRALSIDEEWAVMMALEEERGRGRTSEPPPVAAPAAAHDDLSYLEPVVNPPSSTPVNPWRAPGPTPVPTRDRWRWRWWRLFAVPSLAGVVTISFTIVRLYADVAAHGNASRIVVPFLFLGTLWWNCIIHALYFACVKRVNPSLAFHVGAAIASLTVASIAAFLSVWAFIALVIGDVVSGA